MHALPGRPFEPATLGRVLRARELGWCALTEARYRPHQVLAPHAHRWPALTLVQHGSYSLRVGRTVHECSPREVYYEPGEREHENRVGARGFRSLIVELRGGPGAALFPDREVASGDPRLLAAAARLPRELAEEDAASALALEGLVLELLAGLLRARPRRAAGRGPDPPWLPAVAERLEAESARPPSLGELAAEAGVHPVHLARCFRRRHGCSAGEYARRVRLRRAAEALRRGDRPLAAVAAETGFSDQSHMTRAFRRAFGVTPAVFRAAHRS